jgi:hypothetical protein
MVHSTNSDSNTLLFGKECNNVPRKYSMNMLQQMANKIGLITLRQTYHDLCGGLRKYCLQNNITTKQQFKRHIPKSPVGYTIIDETSTRKLGDNIDLDILFDSQPENFLQEVCYFQNLKHYTSQIERVDGVGSTNSNGFIYKLQYTKQHTYISVILKVNQNEQADNLVYEYLVGQCINEYSRFYPCFAKTYMIGEFSTPKVANYSAFMHLSIPNSFDTYIRPLDIRNTERLILKGCRSNEFLALFTQYIPIRYSFHNYLMSISVGSSSPSNKRIIPAQDSSIHKLYELTAILHMIYQLLASFADKFTHYDLHLDNVVLVEVPANQFIHVVFHYPDRRIVRYNICYIPVIIDYGHCFVHCAQINSKEIMKTVCNNDSKRAPKGPLNPLGPECPYMCGNTSGYERATDYDEASDRFQPSSMENHFIDYTQSNVSHDCRLLHEIILQFDFNKLPRNNFIVKTLVAGIFNKLTEMDSRWGTHEDETWGHTISQIFMAAHKLTELISHPKFNIMNDSFLNDKKLYGTLHIWTDLSRPFEFR